MCDRDRDSVCACVCVFGALLLMIFFANSLCRAILHLLCADDPADRECRLLSTYMFPGDKHKGKHRDQPPLLNSKLDRFASVTSIARVK